MRVHYLDASAWVKRHFEELGSGRIRQLFDAKEPLASSWLGYVEVAAAVARQGRLNESGRKAIEAQLDLEWSRFLQLEAPGEDFALAVTLTRRYQLRGADAVHLATVKQLQNRFMSVGDELVFWTADRELIEAGYAIGIRVENPALS